ncbi:MAG: dTDP-4-dehydrorhamnose 3,5-epimerase [Gemmatimonadota bacterium]|nr:dTDP-4-dehydrorhamnose 3,5-epimerase [Gemmatimonadota bacterium]MDP6528838.1 dTDP-4-dehydrorhamnose 3,5-epimerase [Gemmatimonadota bacterium]MDP6802392.1 dTDP-4-dehydrorhamnose 3,5-epimerase [Gemmatimonadota bacterium]MDP7031093.1 dTDP-4-dehydrorhamnose 3,5-epimerase [Gemmatimonadota bacterium]
MNFRSTELDGVLLVEPRVFRDDRGFFLETFRDSALREAGVEADFVQDNHSRSMKGTIRALHFQISPGQPKLVRCARGSVWDVVVDLRRSSSTFGKWFSTELTDENHRQILVPVGFAHGFCVTSDIADVVYRCGSYYEPSTERGIAWDDPDLAIPWPTDAPVLSDRDQSNPRLADYDGPLFP